MPFPVVCPECEYRFRVPDGVAGKRGKCPKCQATFIAQPAADSDEQAGTAPKKTASKRSAPKKTADAAGPSVSIPKPRMLATAAKAPPAPPAAKSPAAKVPPVTATAAPAAASTPVIQIAPAVGESGASSALYPQRRKRRSSAGTVIALAALALVVLLAVGGGIAWSMFGEQLIASANSGEDDDVKNTESAPTANVVETIAPAPAGGGAVGVRRPEDFTPTDHSRARRALVELEVSSSDGPARRGVGVVVDRRGWVATSFMLVRGASGATATLSDGRRMEVAGWLGRDPQHNLALLKLAAGEDDLVDVESLEVNREFIAPEGYTLLVLQADGGIPAICAGVKPTASLPASGRPRLPGQLRDGEGMMWLAHDVRTADEADGSPLIDLGGRLVGISAALGPTKGGYAVPARHVGTLLDNANEDRLAPLTNNTGPPSDLPDPPTTPPKDNPIRGPLAKFQTLHRLLNESGWRPAGLEDYEGFQQLALLVTIAHEMIDNGEIGPLQQEGIREVTMAAMNDLVKAEWPVEEEMIRINRLATTAPAMENPGLFAYGRCVMRPEHFGAKTIDGSPIFAFELIGTEQLVIVPAGENGSEIRMGSRWLLLGRKDLDEKFPAFSLPSAPDEEREGTVLRTKFMLGSAVE